MEEKGEKEEKQKEKKEKCWNICNWNKCFYANCNFPDNILPCHADRYCESVEPIKHCLRYLGCGDYEITIFYQTLTVMENQKKDVLLGAKEIFEKMYFQKDDGHTKFNLLSSYMQHQTRTYREEMEKLCKEYSLDNSKMFSDVLKAYNILAFEKLYKKKVGDHSNFLDFAFIDNNNSVINLYQNVYDRVVEREKEVIDYLDEFLRNNDDDDDNDDGIDFPFWTIFLPEKIHAMKDIFVIDNNGNDVRIVCCSENYIYYLQFATS